MEILIKAKQSNNPQFEFLNRNSRLNPFYKHTLQSIDNGTYPEGAPSPQAQNPNNADNGKDKNAPYETTMGGYFASSINYPIQMPTIKYKPSADCAYTQLISKIKGLPLPPDTDNATASPGSASQTGGADFDYSAYYGSNTNTSSGASTPTPAALGGKGTVALALIDSEKVTTKLKTIATGVEVKTMSSGLLLAQYYNSDSDTENEEDEEAEAAKTVPKTNSNNSDDTATVELPTTDVPVDAAKLGFPYPPEDLRNMIDKTAAYVLKNGKEFEDILRSKNDPRFQFLHYTDQYNRYYIYKVTGVVCPPVAPQQTLSSESQVNGSQLAVKASGALILAKTLASVESTKAEHSSSSKPAKTVPKVLRKYLSSSTKKHNQLSKTVQELKNVSFSSRLIFN